MIMVGISYVSRYFLKMCVNVMKDTTTSLTGLRIKDLPRWKLGWEADHLRLESERF
jgi:hypothetical protein